MPNNALKLKNFKKGKIKIAILNLAMSKPNFLLGNFL